MKAWEVMEKMNFCKGVYSLDKNNNPTNDLSQTTACCLLGAIKFCDSYLNSQDQIKFLVEVIVNMPEIVKKRGHYSLIAFNDHPQTTKEEVIEVLKELNI